MTEPIAAERIPADLAAHAVPISGLVPYPGNAKRHDLDLIRESLRTHGQYRLAVVQASSGHVLVGNGMLEAALAEGWSELAVTYRDVDDETARRLVLLDNRSSELGGYDDEALAALLKDLPDLSGTGYDEAFLQELLDDLEPFPEPIGDPDDVPPIMGRRVSKKGDVWQLGPHRLACGDSTDPRVLDELMGADVADLVWTDPPYGVAYRAKGHEAIANDDLSVLALTEFLRKTLGGALRLSRPGACWYVAAPTGPAFLAFAAVLTEFKVWRQTLMWAKDQLVLGRSDYHGQHEAILTGATPGAEPAAVPALPEPVLDPVSDGYVDVVENLAYGWTPGAAHQPPPDRRQTTLWEVPRPKVSPDHPTQKPVELITRAILNSTDRHGVVLDVFGGSGSTLIAAHLTGRVARLVELEPKYADVICRRYQRMSGTAPVLLRTGEPVDFEAAS